MRNKEAASLSDVTAHWEASISDRHRSTSFFCLLSCLEPIAIRFFREVEEKQSAKFVQGCRFCCELRSRSEEGSRFEGRILIASLWNCCRARKEFAHLIITISIIFARNVSLIATYFYPNDRELGTCDVTTGCVSVWCKIIVCTWRHSISRFPDTITSVVYPPHTLVRLLARVESSTVTFTNINFSWSTNWISPFVGICWLFYEIS